MEEDEDIIGYCDGCCCEITEDNATSYDNLCVECVGSGVEMLMYFLGG